MITQKAEQRNWFLRTGNHWVSFSVKMRWQNGDCSWAVVDLWWTKYLLYRNMLFKWPTLPCCRSHTGWWEEWGDGSFALLPPPGMAPTARGRGHLHGVLLHCDFLLVMLLTTSIGLKDGPEVVHLFFVLQGKGWRKGPITEKREIVLHPQRHILGSNWRGVPLSSSFPVNLAKHNIQRCAAAWQKSRVNWEAVVEGTVEGSHIVKLMPSLSEPGNDVMV